MTPHAEENHYCHGCKSTQRMSRVIGQPLWQCPQCKVLLNAEPWRDTLQARDLKKNLVKSAEACSAENEAATKRLAARKAEGV